MKPGISFKGITSRSLGLTMKTVNWPIMPSMTRSTVNVPKRAGSVDFGMDTYLESDASLLFSWKCATPEEAMAKGELLSGWLHNDGGYYELTNNAYPNRKYYAKVASAVPLAMDPCIGSINVTFTFNPPYPFALDGSSVSPADAQERLLWDTATLSGSQYIQTFSANGYMRFTLSGTGSNKPVIKLIGYSPSGLQLTYGTKSWKYNATQSWDGIIIDCEAETVTRMSDGANLFGSVNPDTYFQLAPGRVQINITGVYGAWPRNLTVAVDLHPSF